ncbi:MAG: hypothetical protein ACRDFS_04495 [Chloroflexota bacterium]
MSNWGYVAIAFIACWGSLAVYAVVLARRVAQAQEVARQLREAASVDRQAESDLACDTPPAP